jgi:hypothetical protein
VRKLMLVLAIALMALAITPAAYAHGFGERYDLPVPLSFYIAGAGAAVVFSFVVVGLVMRGAPGLIGYPRLDLSEWIIGRVMTHARLVFLIKLVAMLLFLLLILAGIFGKQEPPAENLVPTLVWVIWWVGVAYISAFIGNIWAVINPWKIAFDWMENLYKHADPEGHLSLHISYPRWLGAWPAVAIFGAFAWVENVYMGSTEPSNLAWLVILYSAITWIGMYLFGKHVWLGRGEAFSIFFGLLSKFSPTEVVVRQPEVCRECPMDCGVLEGDCVDCYYCYERADDSQSGLHLRPFASGLLVREGVNPSQMVFVILMLATVTFDGFKETPTWVATVSDTLPNFQFLGGAALSGIRTVGLLVFVIIFLAVFLGFSTFMASFGGVQWPVMKVGTAFIYSMIPIALAYHLAHFFSFLLIQGQLILPLASDPFGFGWDLFGTAEYVVNIAIINARLTWFISLAAIVTGHIVAVYVAHIMALRMFPDRRQAIRSQYPMLVLMVGYTMVSLWILAQPLVENTVGS